MQSLFNLFLDWIILIFVVGNHCLFEENFFLSSFRVGCRFHAIIIEFIIWTWNSEFLSPNRIEKGRSIDQIVAMVMDRSIIISECKNDWNRILNTKLKSGKNFLVPVIYDHHYDQIHCLGSLNNDDETFIGSQILCEQSFFDNQWWQTHNETHTYTHLYNIVLVYDDQRERNVFYLLETVNQKLGKLKMKLSRNWTLVNEMTTIDNRNGKFQWANKKITDKMWLPPIWSIMTLMTRNLNIFPCLFVCNEICWICLWFHFPLIVMCHGEEKRKWKSEMMMTIEYDHEMSNDLFVCSFVCWKLQPVTNWWVKCAQFVKWSNR